MFVIEWTMNHIQGSQKNPGQQTTVGILGQVVSAQAKAPVHSSSNTCNSPLNSFSSPLVQCKVVDL